MIGRIKTQLGNINLFLRQVSYSQFLPSKEDLDSKEAKELSKRLISDSYKETLTNIVEWQEKNVQYWHERAEMFILLFVLSSMPFLLIPLPRYLQIFLVILIIFAMFLDLFTLLIGALFLISEVIAAFVILYTANTANISTIIMVIELSIIFGGIISLLLYGMLKYRYLKASQPEFRLMDTFKSSLPVKKILQYHLAICKDYAKLTATLLINSYYPKNKIYFITIPQHVAAAINVKNKIYVLDQRLPIMTLEKWMDFWSIKMSNNAIFKASSFLHRIFFEGEVQIYELVINGKKTEIKKTDCKKMSEATDVPQIDINSLNKKIAYDMGLSQTSDKKQPDIEINLKNFAVSYNRDEIANFSLLRAVKNKLEGELCGNLGKITKLEVTQNKADLILGVYIS